jgi:hypothetical protein
MILTAIFMTHYSIFNKLYSAVPALTQGRLLALQAVSRALPQGGRPAILATATLGAAKPHHSPGPLKSHDYYLVL